MGRLYATDEVTVPLSLLVGADGRLSEILPGWSDATRRRLEALAAPVAAPPPSPPAAPKPAAAPPPSDASHRISGLVYGDGYYFAASHRPEVDGANGFWLRRVYFTYDHTLSKAFAVRVRLEANSKGDFRSSGVNNAYVKDAYLRWTGGAHSVTFGMAATQNIDFVDTFQGYRSVEKSPFDLYRWDSSRDLGLLVQGGYGAGRRTSLSLQLGNGSGTGSEVDRSKAIRGQIAHRFGTGLVLEAYADWQDRPEGRDVSTLEAFAGWQEKAWRASLQVGRQVRRRTAADGSDLALDFVSAFAAWQLSPRIGVLGRVDRNLDPIPGGETIDYMPFAETAKSTFVVAGVDVTLAKPVHLIPNLEMTVYDDPVAGPQAPASDVVSRLTLFFSW
jgi:hypothetical protein